jgi:type VI secretion system secreted protein Hcp
MYTQRDIGSRWNHVLVIAVVLLMLAMWMAWTDGPQAAAAAEPAAPVAVESVSTLGEVLALQTDAVGSGDIFAKYDGIDGEATDANHDKWVEVARMSWGAHALVDEEAGASRRRGAPTVEGFALTFDYEKASPKLAEKLLKGEVIPKLEVELINTFGEAQLTYLRYELKNVRVVDYFVEGKAGGGLPMVAVVNNFEEIKVTYTEYDDTGNAKGNVEFTYKVGG